MGCFSRFEGLKIILCLSRAGDLTLPGVPAPSLGSCWRNPGGWVPEHSSHTTGSQSPYLRPSPSSPDFYVFHPTREGLEEQRGPGLSSSVGLCLGLPSRWQPLWHYVLVPLCVVTCYVWGGDTHGAKAPGVSSPLLLCLLPETLVYGFPGFQYHSHGLPEFLVLCGLW